jgi:hypothetical protein
MMAESIKVQEVKKLGLVESEFQGMGGLVNYNSVRKLEKTRFY